MILDGSLSNLSSLNGCSNSSSLLLPVGVLFFLWIDSSLTRLLVDLVGDFGLSSFEPVDFCFDSKWKELDFKIKLIRNLNYQSKLINI